MTQDKRALLWALLIFALCDLVLVLPGWWEYGADAVLGSPGLDMLRQFAIWRDYTREALLAGRLPEWNPHLFAGTPFLAAQQAAPFYPPNWCLLGLPTPLALIFGRVLHLLVAQLGAYLLVRAVGGVRLGALLAGLVYSLGAHMSYHFYNGGVGALDGISWSPWLLLAALMALRGRLIAGVALAGAVSSLQILAGYPQLVQLTWFGLLAWIVPMIWRERIPWRQGLGRAGVFVVAVPLLTALASAAVLVPAFEFVSRSARRGFDPAWVGMLSLPPRNLATLLVPDAFGAPWAPTGYWGEGYAWETTLFFGVVPLLLAVWSARTRRALPWVIPIVWLVFLALGQHNPLYLPLAEHLPGMGLFRGPSKYIIPLGLYASVLAGLGLPVALRSRPAIPLALLAGVALVALPLFVQSTAPESWGSWARRVATEGEHLTAVSIGAGFAEETWRATRSAVLLALLSASLALTILVLRRRLGSARAARALVALALVELLLFAASRCEFFSMAQYDLPPELVERLDPGDGQPARVALLSGEEVNRPMAAGLESLSGYEAVLSRRTNGFYNRWEGVPQGEQRYARWVTTCDPVTRLLNQRFLVFGTHVRPPVPADLDPPLELVARLAGHDVYRDPGALPRAFLAPRARVVEDEDQLVAQLVSGAVDPRAEVLLSAPPGAVTLSAREWSGEDEVRVVLHEPEEVRVRVRSRAGGFLVLGDSYDEGWEASVGDVELPVLPAFGFVRSVQLPAGEWEVVFRYGSPVWCGIGLSLLGWLALGALAWAQRRET